MQRNAMLLYVVVTLSFYQPQTIMAFIPTSTSNPNPNPNPNPPSAPLFIRAKKNAPISYLSIAKMHTPPALSSTPAAEAEATATAAEATTAATAAEAPPSTTFSNPSTVLLPNTCEEVRHLPRSNREFIERFQQQGFLLLPNILTLNECDKLRQIIDALDVQRNETAAVPHKRRRKNDQKSHHLHKCVFESYPQECLSIFKKQPVLSIVQDLIAMAGSSRENDRSLTTHVIHNNAFKVDPQGRGQAPTWHADDPPLFIGDLPEGVHVAPLVITCMYYLNDVHGAEGGMTHVVPGSHRYGRPCTKEEVEKMPEGSIYCPPFVSKGSVLLLSSSLWHRGCSVSKTADPRYVFQVSYGRRLVGHKHHSIMDYHLPYSMKQILDSQSDKELMGYLEGGAYS
jgi:ectoine hydroxylase-related dioxygenase (phytanoyl-CoA dioxygenase family)